MSGKIHHYEVLVTWTGNQGTGTSDYRAYERSHEISTNGKPSIPGSSDPAFRGDPARWNPEEMLVASVSTCHQLWYLHLASVAKICVVAYEDRPVGEMAETPDGSGHFTSVTLHPRVTLAAGADAARAEALHHQAHEMCFIANSVNFTIDCVPETRHEA
ncbi:MAG TPA: OsmC family protein [Aliidongia sp.]|uniref:OsmC family protein n=1 Tax=Aliidongia sp. TaxID=1914230 RepID=UPI002DDD0745|nr:OsmC family protein [Aliidongia sp.]HEV2673534.1 OsmC family protein [Aliidongia sp.]